MAKILAIESSCDETAVAITDNGKLLSNVVATQIAVHEKFGGVMPEIASRLHTENITVCLTQALNESGLTLDDIDAFAVTRGPGLIGCLHVGLQAAKTLAMLYKKPLIPVHHWQDTFTPTNMRANSISRYFAWLLVAAIPSWLL